MKSIYREGWRPAAGWVCVAGLANAFLLMPWLNALLLAFDNQSLPPSGLADLVVVLSSVGLAGVRSYDKARGGE